jgi:hypothetical protein
MVSDGPEADPDDKVSLLVDLSVSMQATSTTERKKMDNSFMRFIVSIFLKNRQSRYAKTAEADTCRRDP